MDDRSAAVLSEMLDLAGEDATRRFVQQIGNRAALRDLEHMIAVRAAVQMLEASIPRVRVCGRLVAQGMSERTAYRVISAALDLGPRSSAISAPDLANGLRSIDEPQQGEFIDANDRRDPHYQAC